MRIEETITTDDLVVLSSWITSPESLMQWWGPGGDYPLRVSQLQKQRDEMAERRDIHRSYKATDPHGRIIAYGQLFAGFTEKRLHLMRLIVDPAMRGQGLGKQLVSALVDCGKREWGATTFTLNVFDFNLAALACYRAVGFQQVGYTPNACEVGGNWWNVINMLLVAEGSSS